MCGWSEDLNSKRVFIDLYLRQPHRFGIQEFSFFEQVHCVYALKLNTFEVEC